MKENTILSEQFNNFNKASANEGLILMDYLTGDFIKGFKGNIRSVVPNLSKSNSIVIFITNKGLFISYLTKYKKSEFLTKFYARMKPDEISLEEVDAFFTDKKTIAKISKKGYSGSYRVKKSQYGDFESIQELQGYITNLIPEEVDADEAQESVATLNPNTEGELLLIKKYSTSEEIERLSTLSSTSDEFALLYKELLEGARTKEFLKGD